MTQTTTLIDFATLRKLVIKDLKSSKIPLRYRPEQIKQFLEQPEKFQKELRQVARYVYGMSPHYRRTVRYYSNMLTYDYYLKFYGFTGKKIAKTKAKTAFYKYASYSDNLNIKSEMKKASLIAWNEDFYFGYEHESKDSFFLQQLNPDNCRISSIEDGVYNFAYDFSSFRSCENDLAYFPQEFDIKYQLYKTDPKLYQWQELNSNKSLCLKVNNELPYGYPPFASVFEDIFDIRDYKALKKAKVESDNFAIVTQQIPLLNEKKADDFALSWDSIEYFHEMASEATPDTTGVITSPMKTTLEKFSKDKATEDVVGASEKNYYSSAGVSPLLFSGDKSSSIGLNKSISVDEQDVYGLLYQVEKWHNRKLKKLGGEIQFSASYLELTHNNRDEVFNRMLKGAQNGLSTKLALAASVGMSSSELHSQAYLENDVLGLNEVMVPLKSTHTASAKENDGAGRSEVSDDEASEETIRARDNESNINRQED
ncbi:hypothetical protein ACI2JA_04065 [Alkalihalobacillus sp. NPDC078783]